MSSLLEWLRIAIDDFDPTKDQKKLKLSNFVGVFFNESDAPPW